MGMVALLGAHWTKWFQVRLSVGRLKKIAKDPNTPAEDKAEILQGLQEVNRVRARHETKRIKDVLE
jgi:ABC-type bacteriocin/lantibiotic exporter with double-glycine peptidase domain